MATKPLFGTNPEDQGEITPDNLMDKLNGNDNQAPEGAASKGEPDNRNAAVNGNAEPGQPQQGEQNAGENQQAQPQPDQKPQTQQTEPENISVNDDREKKVEYIQEKFETQDDFEQSVEELQQKLGIEETPRLNDEQEAIDYYIQLENELGQTSDIDETRQRNVQLQQEVQGLRNTVNRLLRQINQPPPNRMQQTQRSQMNQQQRQPQQQGQPRNPQNGQFMSPNQQQPNQQNQPNQQQSEINLDQIDLGDIDQDEFMEEFYQNGANADSFKKAVAQVADQISDQKVNKIMQQFQQQQRQQQLQRQQQQQAQQVQQELKNQVDTIKEKHGEQEFNRYQQDMLNVLEEYPMYTDPDLFPNGMELAFQEARRRQSNLTQQQNYQNQRTQQNTARKKAASIPKSNSNQRIEQNTNNLSQEEVEKAQIFGGEQSQGLWG